jgi:tetratricopeptide (TPR) repeat protein
MAIESDPQFTEAWNNKGYSLNLQGKYDEAIKAYDRALELNPNLTKPWIGKGNILALKGNYDEAIRCFNKNY